MSSWRLRPAPDFSSPSTAPTHTLPTSTPSPQAPLLLTTCARWDPLHAHSWALATEGGHVVYRRRQPDVDSRAFVLEASGQTAPPCIAQLEFDPLVPGRLYLRVAGCGDVIVAQLRLGEDDVQLDVVHVLSSSDAPLVCFSVDLTGTMLATGDRKGSVQVWSIADGRFELVSRIPNAHGRGRAITAIAALSGCVATGSSDQRVLLWDVSPSSQSEVIHAFDAEASRISGLLATRIVLDENDEALDAQVLLAASSDGTVFVFDLETMQLCDLFSYKSRDILTLAATHTGHTVALGYSDGVLSFHRFEDGRFRLLHAETLHGDDEAPCPVVSCEFSTRPEHLDEFVCWTYVSEVDVAHPVEEEQDQLVDDADLLEPEQPQAMPHVEPEPHPQRPRVERARNPLGPFHHTARRTQEREHLRDTRAFFRRDKIDALLSNDASESESVLAHASLNSTKVLAQRLMEVQSLSFEDVQDREDIQERIRVELARQPAEPVHVKPSFANLPPVDASAGRRRVAKQTDKQWRRGLRIRPDVMSCYSEELEPQVPDEPTHVLAAILTGLGTDEVEPQAVDENQPKRKRRPRRRRKSNTDSSVSGRKSSMLQDWKPDN